MKKGFCIVLLILLALLLCACTEQTPRWPGYTGTTEGYTYCHSDPRNREWEEEILFVADKFLNGHPSLSQKNFVVSVGTFQEQPETQYTNALYDEALRKQFIQGINDLIPRIDGLSSLEIPYEILKIIALLEDPHAMISAGSLEYLPLCFEPIGTTQEVFLCAVQMPEADARLLGARLTAINGIPVEEVVEKLTEYIPHQNDYWPIYRMTMRSNGRFSELSQKAALQVIGVVGEDAESAELTFQTPDGTLQKTYPFLSEKEIAALELAAHPMITSSTPRFAYESNYWYTIMEGKDGPCLYVRFLKMLEDSQYPINNFLTDVANELRHAPEPMKLIIDFRDNTGGTLYAAAINSFTQAVNQYETAGTYILINGRSFSSGMRVPYELSIAIDGATLVGSPAGQFVNSFGAALVSYTPNHHLAVYVPDNYLLAEPERDDEAVFPDIPLCQTWEDYQKGIDTVLEYVLSLD